jgi:hypothetical protein
MDQIILNYLFLKCNGNIIVNERMITNDELKEMWNEVVVAYFHLLPQHCPGTVLKHENNNNT